MPRHFVATAVDVDGEDFSRCAEECLRATEGSPGPARCWPVKGEQ